MLKKFLVVALFACFTLNGIVQAEESATEKEKIQILGDGYLFNLTPSPRMKGSHYG